LSSGVSSYFSGTASVLQYCVISVLNIIIETRMKYYAFCLVVYKKLISDLEETKCPPIMCN